MVIIINGCHFLFHFPLLNHFYADYVSQKTKSELFKLFTKHRPKFEVPRFQFQWQKQSQGVGINLIKSTDTAIKDYARSIKTNKSLVYSRKPFKSTHSWQWFCAKEKLHKFNCNCTKSQWQIEVAVACLLTNSFNI